MSPCIDVTTHDEHGHWDVADIKRLCEYRDRMRSALSGLLGQVEDTCGVIDEFVAMPVKSLSDKFPTSVIRLRKRARDAEKVLVGHAPSEEAKP